MNPYPERHNSRITNLISSPALAALRRKSQGGLGSSLRRKRSPQVKPKYSCKGEAWSPVPPQKRLPPIHMRRQGAIAIARLCCTSQQSQHASRPFSSFLANNYGVPSNVPPEEPIRRADGLDLEELRTIVDVDEEAKICRCFRSGTFPLCDGSHVKHNTETGDNVAPLVVREYVGGTINLARNAVFDDDERERQTTGPRANNYGVPSNVPADNPERRLDVRNRSLYNVYLDALFDRS